MRKKLFPALLALWLLFTGCSGTGGDAGETQESNLGFFAMDTYMNLRAWGADDGLLNAAADRAAEIESMLSVTAPDSEIAALNRDGSAALSPDAAELLRRTLELCRATDGALDVTVYPVVRAWGFTLGEDGHRVPGQAELDRLLETVDYTTVTLDGNLARLPDGSQVDLGAVTKGWTGDQLSALLRRGGVEHALLDLGGNIQTVGTKPDGSDWRVAIQDPQGEGLLGVLAVSDSAVVTSGGYERYFVDDDGNLWWHIMDPATGYPAQNGLISVTVVGQEGLVCDALSTALFIMGPEKAVAFWRSHRDWGVETALVTEAGTVLLTPGLAERFTPSSGEYTFQVIADEGT